MNSKHALKAVDCYDCHKAKEDDPSGYQHNGFFVTAVPSPQYCAACHPEEVAENSRSKHAWGGVMGPLKPYYIKAESLVWILLARRRLKNWILRKWLKRL